MSERKYRQRGYQDEGKPRGPRGPNPPRPPQERAPGRVLQDERGPKTPNLMGMHEVFKCARCGNKLPLPVELASKCSRCGADLHSCVQCVSFDTSARWECTQPIPARIFPKDARNECAFYEIRMSSERETTSSSPVATARPNDPRQAFERLFKK